MDATTAAALAAKIAALPAGTNDFAAYQELVDQPSVEEVRLAFTATRAKHFQAIVTALAAIPAADLPTLGTQALYQRVVPNAISFSDFRDLFLKTPKAAAPAPTAAPVPTANAQTQAPTK